MPGAEFYRLNVPVTTTFDPYIIETLPTDLRERIEAAVTPELLAGIRLGQGDAAWTVKDLQEYILRAIHGGDNRDHE